MRNHSDALDRGVLPGQRVLDLGCGYGVVGIAAAKTVGSQCGHGRSGILAVEYTLINARLNDVCGVQSMKATATDFDETNFDLILNPPYHVDFSVPKLYRKGIQQTFGRRKNVW